MRLNEEKRRKGKRREGKRREGKGKEGKGMEEKGMKGREGKGQVNLDVSCQLFEKWKEGWFKAIKQAILKDIRNITPIPLLKHV